jgi:hypothetical protein
MPDQNIDQHDLILVSDTGDFYLVKMAPDGNGGHQPDHIEPLAPQFQGLPTIMRDNGVELADIPDNVLGGGCSCFLLNLKRLSGL